MKSKELKEAILHKTHELEVAMELKKPQAELLQLYKELKELQYKNIQIRLTNGN